MPVPELPQALSKKVVDGAFIPWEIIPTLKITDNFGIDLAVKAGNTHITRTEEETEAFNVALEPVVDRWIDEVDSKGIDGQALVDSARAAIASHSNQSQ